jgi:putative ABC transport system permease protein
MGALLRDLRFAARMLVKSPGTTLVAVLTLALGIGANTAIFSTVNAVLIRPLPYQDPDRLVVMWETSPAFKEMSVAYPSFLDYRARNRTFTDMGAFRSESYNLTGQGEPERLSTRMVSASLFPTLGVKPMLGRVFTEEEDAPDGRKTVMLSHGLWKRRFASDSAIVGKTIQLNGIPFEVIGVLGPDFRIFGQRDAYVPLGLKRGEKGYDSHGNHPGIYVIGRLAPGVTLDQARADMAAVGEGMQKDHGDDYGTVRPAFEPLRENIAKELRPSLLLLLGAVLFVLLIAAANVANLMLARAMTRHKEMAIRAALGSGRLRLVRQLLVESTLLALLGGALGLLLAMWGVDLLAAARPEAIEFVGPLTIDGRVLGYTLVIALGTGLLFGLAPALHASRQDLAGTLKEGDQRATAGSGRQRLRNALVVGEVALAMVLLVGAGLAIRGFQRLTSRDPGFRPDHLLSFQVQLPPSKYREPAELIAFYDELGRRLRALPGVESATVSDGLPFVGAPEASFVSGVTAPGDESRFAVLYVVDSAYQDTLGIPLLAGRRFDAATDRLDGEPVAIVDEALAARFFPEGAIGETMRLSDTKAPSMRIVGVVKHVAHYGLEGPQPAPYQFYVPLDQVPPDFQPMVLAQMHVTVRTSGDPMALASAVRGEVMAIDPEQPVFAMTTLDEQIAESVADRRFTTGLLGVFAALALLLATVGLYAVLASSVTQRTHEIGVRMALGAQPGDVVRLVVRQGLTLVIIGVVVGVGGAFGLTRLMQKILSGVSPTDPLTFAAMVAVLVAVGVLATYIPARRATRVDPMVALRHE